MKDGRIEIGDRVSVYAKTLDHTDGKGRRKPQTGTVVYIHPRGRYCTVEFETGKGATLRESFLLYQGRIVDE
ncbi:MAG: hypothetical protein E7211_18845 [Clostridium lundense]|jgi:hypothetical protein|nr:hypothetical protein [Clostridium lundense]